MKNWTLLALALAAILIIPAASTPAEAPDSPTAAALFTAQEAGETTPEAIEAPSATEDVDLDLNLDALDLPKMQKKIRQCTESEAASIGCAWEDCLCIGSTPRCF
ncbi:MAG: hypothetical protein K0U98_01180 [Deltaproteobacteria bacterium]|nr:hypothetical protein [Deltaproteobacteria bacterium]